MIKYKRGDKHPIEDLVFYQYNHFYHKKTNGEVWLSPEEFKRRKGEHNVRAFRTRKHEPFRALLSNAYSRGKKYGNSDITMEFIRYLWDKQKGKCYWFNVNMSLEQSVPKWSRNPLKVSIDRLDNSKGYTKDNIVLSCYAANCGRANCSVKDWINIVQIIKNGLNNNK